MRMALAALLLGLSAASPTTLAAAQGPGDAAVDPRQAETVEVRLSNFAFTPAAIRLQAGRPYVLKLIDTASGGHDFSAPAFFKAARIAPGDAARAAKGKINLKGGETVSIHLVPAAGEYPLRCTHFGHSTFGMTGKIIVTGAS